MSYWCGILFCITHRPPILRSPVYSFNHRSSAICRPNVGLCRRRHQLFFYPSILMHILFLQNNTDWWRRPTVCQQLILAHMSLRNSTRSSANAEGPREHAVSWNLVKCYINGRWIAFEKPFNWWMTFKVIRGHCRWYRLIYDFLLVLHWKYISILYRFRDINTYLP